MFAGKNALYSIVFASFQRGIEEGQEVGGSARVKIRKEKSCTGSPKREVSLRALPLSFLVEIVLSSLVLAQSSVLCIRIGNGSSDVCRAALAQASSVPPCCFVLCFWCCASDAAPHLVGGTGTTTTL